MFLYLYCALLLLLINFIVPLWYFDLILNLRARYFTDFFFKTQPFYEFPVVAYLIVQPVVWWWIACSTRHGRQRTRVTAVSMRALSSCLIILQIIWFLRAISNAASINCLSFRIIKFPNKSVFCAKSRMFWRYWGYCFIKLLEYLKFKIHFFENFSSRASIDFKVFNRSISTSNITVPKAEFF